MGGRIIVQQEKISRAEGIWTNPLNALQEAIHYSFIKFSIYCFSVLYEFFVHYALRVPKNYQHGLDAGSLEFQFLRPNGCLTNPFGTLSLWVGVTGKTPRVISRNNSVKKKKKLSASAVVIMSCQDVNRSSLCSGVKDCGSKRAHSFHFPKSSFRFRRTSLGDVQRFWYNSWCDSTVFFYQISNSSNVYLISSRFWTANSVIYQLPSVSKSRIPPKNVWSVQSLISISLLHQC